MPMSVREIFYTVFLTEQETIAEPKYFQLKYAFSHKTPKYGSYKGRERNKNGPGSARAISKYISSFRNSAVLF